MQKVQENGKKKRGQCHKFTQAFCSVGLAKGTVGEGENTKRLGGRGLRLSKTNHAGMSKSAAKKGRKRAERVHAWEKSIKGRNR